MPRRCPVASRGPRSTPSFQGVPAGNPRPATDAEHRRLDRRPDVDVGMADDEHVRRLHRGGEPALLRPVHQVVHQDAEPAPRAGAELGRRSRAGRRCRRDTPRPRRRRAGRPPRSSRPVRRRGGPRRRYGSPGRPWPGWAGRPRTLRRCARWARRPAGAGPAATGLTSMTGSPSSRKAAGPSGNTRRLPYRSSSVTASFSHSTTAPQNRPVASSTTSPGSAGTRRSSRRWR